MAANGAGTMITFYSYKGGTGRSMTLANVAWILASCGKKVLVIDWDLEAPGLHRYFQPFLVDADLVDTDGLIDYFWKLTRAIMTHAPDNSQSLAESLPQILDYRVKVDWPFESDGTLDFVPAGRQGTNYAQRVNSFDWNNFYGRLGGGNALDQMRNELKQAYDYVLIDSRTGVSDTSGICTVQMPDVLVGLFTLNNQSIEGVAAILASATGLRDPGREGDLEVFPVVSRVEDGEQDKLEAARGYARKVFLQFMGDRTQREVREYWDDMELPYRKFYAYEEVLATFGDLTGTLGSQTSLLSATERLTRRITNEQVALPRIEEERRQKVLAMYSFTRGPNVSIVPVSEEIPVIAREGEHEVSSAGVQVESPRLTLWQSLTNWIWGHDFFISYEWRNGGSYAVALAERLRSMRFDVSLDRNEFVAGDHLDREIVKRVRGARVLIVVATPEAVKSRWVKREIETFAREGKRVVPIVFGNIPGGSTGLQLASHVYIRESRDNLMKGPATEVVQTIARTFHAFRRRTIRTALVLLMLVVLVIQIAVVLATVFRQFEAKSQLHDTKQGTGKTDNQGPQSKERQGIP